jgi:hypothetical protein
MIMVISSDAQINEQAPKIRLPFFPVTSKAMMTMLTVNKTRVKYQYAVNRRMREKP